MDARKRRGTRRGVRGIPRSSAIAPSQAPEPAVTLVAPVRSARTEYVRDRQRGEVLRLLVPELRGHLQSQGRAVAAIERPVVHLVTEQRLRVPRGRHVDRLVVVIRAG